MSKYAITAGVQDTPVKTVLYGPEASARAPLPPTSPTRCSSTPKAAQSG